MLSVKALSSVSAAVGYYFGAGVEGCAPAAYYTAGAQPGRVAGRWLGGGAGGLGLAGAWGVDGPAVFEGLLAGRDPGGVLLAGPVWRHSPRARVPAVPLIDAVRSRARSAGVMVDVMLGSPRLCRAYSTAVASLDGTGARTRAGVPIDVALDILERIGAAPDEVYPGTAGGVEPVATALARRGERVDVRVPGLDLTFSAPKSVSLLWAFAPDEQVRGQVAAAHAAAVDAAVAWLEGVAGQGQRGHQGGGRRAGRVATSGFVAAGFDHATSREDDPQLHTHVVVANLLHGVDGRWSALDTRGIHRAARTAGFVYQAVLRGQLTDRLGVGWGAVARGTAEVAGIDQAACRMFSRRRRQIEKAMAAAGTAGPAAAQAACLATRAGKTHRSWPDLLARWTRTAAAAGVGDLAGQVAAAIAPTRRVGTAPVTGEDAEARCDRLGVGVAWRLLAPDGLTRSRSTFDRRDLLRAVCQALPAGTRVDVGDLEAIVDRVLARPDVVPVEADASDGGPGRWTTVGMLEVEAAALDAAAALRAAPAPVLHPDLVDAAVAAYGLRGEQAALVATLTAGTGGLAVVVGPAGSGKTASLAAANAAWRQSGVRVHGAALSGLAARGLQAATGMPASTIADLLTRLAACRQRGLALLPAGSVLVIDEAAMVGTRDLAAILTAACDHRWRLVLVGDPRQLPEIEAGGLFAALASDADATLTANKRQQDRWERHALADLRDGRVGPALDAYLAHGRVAIHPDTDAQNLAAATDYLTYRDRLHAAARPGAPPPSVGLLAATRAQARTLNDLVRAERTARGELTGPQLHVERDDGRDGGRCYAVGDRVILTAPDRDRGLVNGQTGYVTGLRTGPGRQPAPVGLALRLDDGRSIDVDPAWIAGHLDHGYALTVHKAQGQTHDVTIVAGSAALTAETAYTALSRARHGTHLHLAPDPHAGDTTAGQWLADQVLSQAARSLHTSRRHQLATRLRWLGTRPTTSTSTTAIASPTTHEGITR